MKKHTVNDLPDYIDINHIAFTSTDDITQIARPLYEKLGINYFAHAISYHDGYATTLITHLDVVIHWIVEKYSLPGSNPKGPRILSGNYFVPFMDNIYPIPYRKALSEIFHIDNMLLIVESYKERDEFFSFATEPDNYKIINYYLNNIDIFKRFIAGYKIRAKNLIKLAIKTRVPIPLSSEQGKTDIGVLSLQEKASLLAQVTPTHIPIGNGAYLTNREIDCLYISSEGKSAKEIANILNISYRTVEMHLGNAKNKLQCQRKSQMLDAFFNLVEQYQINTDYIKSRN